MCVESCAPILFFIQIIIWWNKNCNFVWFFNDILQIPFPIWIVQLVEGNCKLFASIPNLERIKQKKYAAVLSAFASQRNLSEVEMVNDNVDNIIHDVGEGDNSKNHQHTAQSSIIYPGGSGSKYISNIGAGHAPNWTRSRSRPYQ
jgi:hypothetical protein